MKRWLWGSVRDETGRIKKANKAELERDTFQLNDPYAVFRDSDGKTYHTTLEDCDCDGKRRWYPKQACSHMIRLAMEVGILDNKGRLESEQLFDALNYDEQLLMLYSWYYHARHEQLITDEEYNTLKVRGFGDIQSNTSKTEYGNTVQRAEKMTAQEAKIEGQGKRKMGDERFTITNEIGILSVSESGWTKEINMISWNGEKPKMDIRSWSPDRAKMSKGITLSDDEVDKLYDILKSMHKI